jgi:PAS domain S-box-containing protein
MPIVVLTGLDDEELGLKAVQLGAQDYMIKGQVMGNILVRTVRYAIERKRIEEELKKHRDHLEELLEERKKKEEQQRESEEKYRTIIDNIQEGYYEVDLAGNFTFFNDSLCRMLDYSKDELMGMNNRLYMDEKSAKKVFQIFNKVYEKRIPYKSVDFQIKRKDGIRKFGEISVSLMKDSRNQPIGFRGIVHDITERKQEETIRNILFTISKATAKTSSLDDLLATIHKQVGTLMYAKNFFVCLTHDTEKNLCTFPYYKDINPEEEADNSDPDKIFEITEGLTHHVLKTKKYLLANKEELKKIGVIGTVPESWLGVPLKTERGDVSGVIAVQSYEKKAYSEKDAQVLSIIASNITGALKYKKAEEQIRASLTEKEVLLKEIHHRVKNNMQIISSLIKLQSRHIKDETALEFFKSTQNRIRSMAIIHEKLYKSKDFAGVDFAGYIQILAKHLFNVYGVDPKAIKININIKDVLLNINTAIPCGLIINELLSNSLKYAFPDGKKGEISIAIHPIDKNEMELIVNDNGVGLPEEIDIKHTESLGLHLVTILVEDQLQGDIKLDRTGGTRFYIRIKVSQ